mgnify:CR=1 FL=1
MPTKIPPSFEEKSDDDLYIYLDAVLTYNQRFLQGTRLEWAIDPINQLLRRETSPVRHIFPISPASSSLSRHHCYRGGLMYHSIEVFYLASTMWCPAIGVGPWSRDERAALWIASLLHDMNKCCDPLGRSHYIANTLKNGAVSTAKPWKVNENFLSLEGGSVDNILPPEDTHVVDPLEGTHGIMRLAVKVLNTAAKRIADGKISFLLACHCAPEVRNLPEDIQQAIFFHDGGYGQGRYEMNGNENRLTIMLHAADMLSSRFERDWDHALTPISMLRDRLPPTAEEIRDNSQNSETQQDNVERES